MALAKVERRRTSVLLPLGVMVGVGVGHCVSAVAGRYMVHDVFDDLPDAGHELQREQQYEDRGSSTHGRE